MTQSIANLKEQFQQLRTREDASTSTGRISNAAVEQLELLIKHTRQDFEAQMTNHRQDVKNQLKNVAMNCTSALKTLRWKLRERLQMKNGK